MMSHGYPAVLCGSLQARSWAPSRLRRKAADRAAPAIHRANAACGPGSAICNGRHMKYAYVGDMHDMLHYAALRMLC